MLNLKYLCDSENINGTIFLIFEEPPVKNPYATPLKFSLRSSISGLEIWSGTFNNPGDWSSFPFGFHTEAEVQDSLGSVIMKWKWDPVINGDPIYKFFNSWASKNRGAFGVAIGTHDGTSGEWVEPLRRGLIEALLIEASDNQFKSLTENYKGFDGAYTYKCLVTPKGGITSFFEIGSGHVNSVKLDHVQNYAGEFNSPIIEKKISSLSIVELFRKLQKDKIIKWLHLDTEGLDGELILALIEEKIILPEVIIYENLNLPGETQNMLLKKLSLLGYEVFTFGWNTLAQRTNE